MNALGWQVIHSDLEAQNVTLKELHIDRGYLNSHLVKERDENLTIICKAWSVRNGKYFDKTAFVLNWEEKIIRCPNGVSVPFDEGKPVQFPRDKCKICPLRSQCTTNVKGRTVSIHPDESLLQELRERQTTPSGRAKLRERVTVEHSLAHIGQWQGDRARYIGVRKNLFDLRRMAVVHNLHLLARMPATTQEKTASILSLA
ncbi:MAG: transposase [Hormoscilla sp. GUM202]|nr:transposase [Hormoscilla sp. GUM202]